MANIKSAIKRAKTNEKARQRNASRKSALRTSIKKFVLSTEDKDTKNSATLLSTATKALDKAVNKGIIHKNAAARKKSRLTKRLNSMGS